MLKFQYLKLLSIIIPKQSILNQQSGIKKYQTTPNNKRLHKMIEDLIHQIDSERNFFSIQNSSSIEIEKFINLSYFPSLSLFNGTIFINSKKYKTYLENECKKKWS